MSAHPVSRTGPTPMPYRWWQGYDAHDHRAIGALLGLACGDALGTTLEFTRPPAHPWHPLLDGPHHTITGGGPFRLMPGQVTDDTQMACCLAASLAAHDGRCDAHDLAERYRAWSVHAFDIGGQTAGALRAFARSGDPATSGLDVWRTGGCRAAGNGALMRCAPIGACIADPDQRQAAVIADALITHADPRCVLSGAVYVAAIAAGVAGGDLQDMQQAALAAIAPAAAELRGSMLEQDAITAAEEAVHDDIRLAQEDDPDLYGDCSMTGSAMGFVRLVLRLAFWELAHAPNPAAAMIDAVNRGGDADTNGAIVGALTGALHGPAAIPAAWRTAVLDCQPPPPWDGLYHPRVLLGAWWVCGGGAHG